MKAELQARENEYDKILGLNLNSIPSTIVAGKTIFAVAVFDATYVKKIVNKNKTVCTLS
ncbi:hypothetical protein OAT67_05800 [Bacteriovoracaceae bacterium]|nr:hypothetical protein [Bacteriovoracaceae bacterium]